MAYKVGGLAAQGEDSRFCMGIYRFSCYHMSPKPNYVPSYDVRFRVEGHESRFRLQFQKGSFMGFLKALDVLCWGTLLSGFIKGPPS